MMRLCAGSSSSTLRADPSTKTDSQLHHKRRHNEEVVALKGQQNACWRKWNVETRGCSDGTAEIVCNAPVDCRKTVREYAGCGSRTGAGTWVCCRRRDRVVKDRHYWKSQTRAEDRQASEAEAGARSDAGRG
ncbi:hypothetical protein NL676_029678 [Syzygium grande]|nr:hypothetical protein NL676_029678 [Syzygium grande]